MSMVIVKLSRLRLDIAAAQLVLVGKADGVDHEVEVAPAVLDLSEQPVERRGIANIAFDQKIAAQRLGQWAHALFQRSALMRET